MFLLKKILSLLVMPIPLLVLGLLLVLILWQRRALARSLLMVSVAALVFLSSTFGSNMLINPLEQRYSANPRPIEGDCVVSVLGFEHDDAIHGSAVQQLSPVALARLTEGLKQMSLGKDCTLIVSGYRSDYNRFAHADVMKQAAMELGVPEAQIIALPLARDTLEEARQIKALGLDVPIRLVTSAAHMPRAMAMFAHEGLNAEAAPTDFTARRSTWWRLNAETLSSSQKAIHEYVGTLWFELRYGA
ncbi:YdcF family protein [Shewanella litorisediminis]|uniref:YdcF family protein n=1 Tax=Shewanella litorisediminis TaxID=1173586 RepID=A0ABX7FZP7_9GAMM|nr:YdcF family protein [Shewanella litorisediminis]MCL2919614.1 YdcF family protein [Shewanella litorisediminis]QRH00506.1 YdcF family protein [Shewanella litorisediminis]